MWVACLITGIVTVFVDRGSGPSRWAVFSVRSAPRPGRPRAELPVLLRGRPGAVHDFLRGCGGLEPVAANAVVHPRLLIHKDLAGAHHLLRVRGRRQQQRGARPDTASAALAEAVTAMQTPLGMGIGGSLDCGSAQPYRPTGIVTEIGVPGGPSTTYRQPSGSARTSNCRPVSKTSWQGLRLRGARRERARHRKRNQTEVRRGPPARGGPQHRRRQHGCRRLCALLHVPLPSRTRPWVLPRSFLMTRAGLGIAVHNTGVGVHALFGKIDPFNNTAVGSLAPRIMTPRPPPLPTTTRQLARGRSETTLMRVQTPPWGPSRAPK